MANQHTKLTLVSVWFRGRRFSCFVNLPVDFDGKIRIDPNQIIRLSGFPIENGQTYSLGS